ncbi:MAG: polyprenyl diphosphate synthase [Oscillospiraceae bacterium]|nr:polyprenyl diphosphate synthase [Oscillospiraceae bacterium]
MDNFLPEADALPKHIGIIMDGNGRWAKKRGLPRKLGHREGAKVFKKCVDDCIDLQLQCVTFYAFSTENAKRPQDEVSALIKLFDEYLDDIRKMNDKNVRLRFLGELSFFPEKTRMKMFDAENATKNNTGLQCSLALNYGGRSEIIHAVQNLMANDCGSVQLTEETFGKYLYTSGLPDVDLIIRTGGEKRISNFLLWQAAYAEYIFTDVLWCDFGKSDLEAAIREFSERNRRFGKI